MKPNQFKKIFSVISILTMIFLSLGIVGCAVTEQARTVEESGFLGDYSLLQHGKDDRALLYYVNSKADFAKYDKVLIDPVTIWMGENMNEKVSREELQNLAHYLYISVKAQLETDYKIVKKPEPHTMRLRLAFTELEGSKVSLDIATTYLPPARLISEVKKLTTGTQSFVGEASIEMDLVDANTGYRLAAAMDKRAGGKHYEGSTDTWADIKEAADYWAAKIKEGLAELRTK